MTTLRFSLLTSLVLAACAQTEAPDAEVVDDAPASIDGKADGNNDAWCKEVAGEYARRLYNDFKDFEILETTVATIVDRGSGFMWIQTDSSGHGSESTDYILMASACYPIGSLDVIEDEGDAVFFARRAAAATKSHVIKTWDFGAIISAELRWPITSRGVIVDVRVLDDAHDEGAFEVELTRSGKVRRLVQTLTFTP